MAIKQRVILIILDGWGISSQTQGNATLQTNLPFFNYVLKNYPATTLSASSESVGLMMGEMGNSEVGHLNIGAGRVVWQDLARVTRSIEDRSFFKKPALLELLKYVKTNHKKLHLIGLISDGGVHSHINHLIALLSLIQKYHLPNINIHMITDGRDTPPKNALRYLTLLEKPLKDARAKIVTVSGRYFAMDRDKHWDRTRKAYQAIAESQGKIAQSPNQAINLAYTNNETDEFITPTIIQNPRLPNIGKIDDSDGIIFFNFRPDRMRQITSSLLDPKFSGFLKKTTLNHFKAISMTNYDEDQKLPISILFSSINLKNVLAEVISNHGLKQLHIAETEKYAHVTYFFNGGREKPFPKEDRILIPSSRVATYDLKPEMSAKQITHKIIQNLNKYDFIVANYANPDMVGHTGNLKAAIQAIEILDLQLKQIFDHAKKLGIFIMITSDHGNVEQMLNTDGGMVKEHSINPVPLILINKNNKLKTEKDLLIFLNQSAVGVLADIAPTVLNIMQLKIPVEMTGQSLLENI